jgi:hypothetical protein
VQPLAADQSCETWDRTQNPRKLGSGIRKQDSVSKRGHCIQADSADTVFTAQIPGLARCLTPWLRTPMRIRPAAVQYALRHFRSSHVE